MLPWTAAVLCAARAAVAQDLAADLERYVTTEYAMNAAFVGVGAANLSAGAWALTRGDDIARGAGVPLVVFGGVQLTVGAVFLARTPGVHRRGRALLALDPERYRADERARIERVVTAFPWYLAVDGAAVLAGAIALGVGVANADATVTGVGVGLLATGPLQFALDATTWGFAAAHLRGLTLRW